MKSDGVNTDRGFISSKKPNKYEDETFSLRYDSEGSKADGTNGIKAAIKTTDGVQTYESASNVQTTEWQHITLTWQSGQKLKLYINSMLDQPTFNSPAKRGKMIDANRLVIGKGSQDTHMAWRGLVDDVRLYNRVLSAREIAELPYVTKTDVPIHGVAIAGSADLTDDTIVPKASDVKYALTVTNTGTTNDTMKLTTSGNVTATLSETSVSLTTGASSVVRLTVPGTVLATAGEYVVDITATSQGDTTKTAQLTATTTVSVVAENITACYQVKLAGIGDLTNQTQDASTGATYYFTVTNSGTTKDTIRLTTTGDATGTLSRTSVSLSPGTSSDETLTIPGTALKVPGEYVVDSHCHFTRR